MAQKQLCLDNLGELDDGRAALIIDAAIREALADLDDRGDDEKPRKVKIELTLQIPDRSSGLVEATVDASAVIPKRRTATTYGRVAVENRFARLVFQTGAPDNPDQRTIEEVTGERE